MLTKERIEDLKENGPGYVREDLHITIVDTVRSLMEVLQLELFDDGLAYGDQGSRELMKKTIDMMDRFFDYHEWKNNQHDIEWAKRNNPEVLL